MNATEEPIHETPPGEEGDDSINAPDDAHTITEDDLDDTDDLDDDDDDE